MLSVRDIFMYSPVVDTLKRGFEALGAHVRIRAGPTGAVRSSGLGLGSNALRRATADTGRVAALLLSRLSHGADGA